MASNHNVLSVGELQEWLNKKADIEEVKLTDFSDAFAKMLNYNALNCLLNNGAITDSTQLKFRLYHLRNTDQNAPYYNIPDSDSYIYVVFEQETGYMVSNCAKLQWELTIARGVSDFAPNERTGIARSSATVKFLYGLAGSGSRQKVTIAYDIKWSERPIYVGIDSFGIGWIAADSSSHQLATKTASAVGEVSYCYASTGNSAGLSSSVDMDTSQSGGVVGTPVIINHQNTSTYGKHISGTVGVGTQSNSSNMETIQIFVAYAHSTVSVTFSADVALQWKQVGMSINFTPQKKTTIIARGNATFKYNGQGYQTAGTV